MFKAILPCLFSFDVEWIPDPVAAELLYDVQDEPPHSLEDAFRVLWKNAGATPENPQPFIKTMLSRIVSISGIFREEHANGEVTLELVSLPRDVSDSDKCKESAILTAFLKAVGRRHPQLVGYNSANSDIPIIVERSIAHGLSSHGFGARPEKPWEGADYFSTHGDYHVDLATVLGRWNMTPRLHEAANLCGIPGKMGISGDSVAQMWLMGDLQGIVNYNEYDAFTTHLLWARMAHFGDLLSTAQYEAEQERVRALLEKEITAGHLHLVAYLEEWERLKARLENR